MISLWDAIQSRRSIRKYLGDDVPDAYIRQMLEAARLAPSGSNNQPWRFIVVRDANVRSEICKLHNGQRFIEEAPVTIVCFGDLDRYSQEVNRAKWSELIESGIAAELSGNLATPEFWNGVAARPTPPRERRLTSAVSNAYIAVEHLLLMATALGLGTCWLNAVDNPKLNELFGLPDNIVSVAVIPVGYPAGKIPAPRPRISIEQMLLKPFPVQSEKE